jgi:ferredoxin
MADKRSKLPENVPGHYYVDDHCFACSACVGEAPANFCMNEDASHAYVCKQPENAMEKELCESCISICPVSAIGKGEA